jgi:hypothetical protein
MKAREWKGFALIITRAAGRRARLGAAVWIARTSVQRLVRRMVVADMIWHRRGSAPDRSRTVLGLLNYQAHQGVILDETEGLTASGPRTKIENTVKEDPEGFALWHGRERTEPDVAAHVHLPSARERMWRDGASMAAGLALPQAGQLHHRWRQPGAMRRLLRLDLVMAESPRAGDHRRHPWHVAARPSRRASRRASRFRQRRWPMECRRGR